MPLENKGWNGCSGALPVILINDTPTMLETEMRVIERCTNNIAELTAIEIGVQIAIRNMDKYERINLFSDSEISIKTLRDWIFKWVRGMKVFQNKEYCEPYMRELKTVNGTIVANQIIIKNIINMICSIDPNVCQFNIYHCKGHCLGKGDVSRDTFFKSNGIVISEDDALLLAKFNDVVDNETRDTLYKNKFDKWFVVAPFAMFPTNLGLYRQIIGSRGF